MRLLYPTAALTLAAIAFVPLPPLHQPQDYHAFADTRALAGLPNALDVLSNLPFALVGAAGLRALLGRGGTSLATFQHEAERWPYVAFFAGVLLTAFGSAYYHLAPDDARLVWDRLPMTLGFMGILSATVAERLDRDMGLRMLPALLALGLLSVVYWVVTEDLRPYAIVQAGSVLGVLLLLLRPSPYTGTPHLLLVVGLYVAAKVVEGRDRDLYEATSFVSGHTIKHLLAGAATYLVLRMLLTRRVKPERVEAVAAAGAA